LSAAPVLGSVPVPVPVPVPVGVAVPVALPWVYSNSYTHPLSCVYGSHFLAKPRTLPLEPAANISLRAWSSTAAASLAASLRAAKSA